MPTTQNTTDHPLATIFHPDLKFQFPRVYKVVETVTFEDVFRLRDGGLEEDFPIEVGVFTSYKLNPDPDEHNGKIEFTPIESLDENEEFSIVVRWHKTDEHALAYIQGISDVGANSPIPVPIFRTNDGAFTLVEIETNDMWPSPMIFFLASYSDEKSFFGVNRFEMSTSSRQKAIKTNIFRFAI